MTTSYKALPIWIQQWWVWFAAIFIITFVSFWPSFFSAIVNIETHIIIPGAVACRCTVSSVLASGTNDRIPEGVPSHSNLSCC